MIFNHVQLNDGQYDVEGQIRETDEREIRASFNSLSLGNELKQFHETNRHIDLIVFKQDDVVKFKAENVVIDKLTIDNYGYRASFKEQ